MTSTKASFILLEDDKLLQPAENIVPVIRTDILDAYGTELSDTLNGVVGQMTTARFGLDAEDADVLAKEWLTGKGLI